MENYLDILQTSETLRNKLQGYFDEVLDVWRRYGMTMEDEVVGDHVGFQVISVSDFDRAHEMLLKYSVMTMDHVIHQRRNRCYRFKQALSADTIKFEGIEIFEPKPNTKIGKLRPGIEHLAVVVKNYEKAKNIVQRQGLGIAKEASYGAGKFFKTNPIGNVEVEFRNVPLIQ